jgi:hypothetical protein
MFTTFELRGCAQDFGGIPIVLFCGDFHQFRPIQERSIVLPSSAVPWDEEKSFRVEQRYQHDKAHGLWKKFTIKQVKIGHGGNGGHLIGRELCSYDTLLITLLQEHTGGSSAHLVWVLT